MPSDKPRQDKVFFDPHMHLYNLSHPGFLAFINRFFLNSHISFNWLIRDPIIAFLSCAFGSDRIIPNILKKLLLLSLLLVFSLITYSINQFFFLDFVFKKMNNSLLAAVLSQCGGILCTILFSGLAIRFMLWDKPQKVINMLSIMENDVGSILLQLELDYFACSLKLTGKTGKENKDANIRETELHTFIEKNLKDPDHPDRYFIDIGNNTIMDRVIFAPLLMDFGSKGHSGKENIYYNQTPKKPIVEQVVDVCNGIKRYMDKSRYHLLEVYPFMGLNPGIYEYREEDLIRIPRDTARYFRELFRSRPGSVKGKVECFKELKATAPSASCSAVLIAIEKITGYECECWEKAVRLTGNDKDQVTALIRKITEQSKKGTSIQALLYKYFGKYNGDNPDLYNYFRNHYEWSFAKGHYAGDIDKLRSFVFAGIKLYPALDFDPWPGAADKKRTTDFFYKFCNEKKIPITVHCQHSSFQIVTQKEKEEFTDPARWQPVFKIYPQLKVNFAHMGFQDKPAHYSLNAWTKTVIAYLNNKDLNVYADFAAHGVKGIFYGFYKAFNKILHKNNIDKTKILFGSDFMLNLFRDNSYKDYLEYFCKNASFPDDPDYPKAFFYNKNPGRFLFNWKE